MKRILSKAVAFLLILSMFTATFAAVPKVATENVAMAAEAPAYSSYGSYDVKSYYNTLKDYKKTLAHNKEKYKNQRTDDDAIKKLAIDTYNDKDIIALAKQITGSKKSDYDKIKAVYNWVTENIYYDWDLYRGTKGITADVVDGDPAVIYERRYAICGGYSTFTAALLRAVGIPARSIGGVVSNSSKVGHAWTEAWVSSEKRWLIMDSTWGSGNKYEKGVYKKGNRTSKYFDMSLETMSKTHIITNISEVMNKVNYHYNVKGQKDMYVALPYKSFTTYKNPPANPGHTFGGWYKDEALTEKWDFEKEKLLTDVHIYAKWIPIIYTIKFDSNGGTPVESVKANYGERLKRPKDPTREGYIFGGWAFTKNGTDYWNFSREPNIHTVTKNLTLYATWQKPFTITFDSDGGTPVPSAKTGYNGLVPQPSVIPKKDGYTFAGWYYKKNAKESDRPVYFGEVSVKADTTFYARWVSGGSSSGSSKATPTPTKKPTPTASPTPKPPTGITPDYTAVALENGTYNIHPANNTKLSIDIERSGMLDVTPIIYYTSTTNNNQKFNLTRVGDYQYTITAVHSGKNLTSSGLLGGTLRQNPADGNYKQVFTIMKYSDGYYRIQDFEGYFAGTSGGNAKSNTSVIMWEEALNCSQEFVLTKLETVAPAVTTPSPTPTPTPTPEQNYYASLYATADTIDGGTYSVLPYISPSLAVDVPNSSKTEGTGLILYGITDNDNQQFIFKKVGANQYTITAKHSGLSWTSPGVVDGKITQSAAKNSSNQIFTITTGSSSKVFKIQDSNGLYVGFPNGMPEKDGDLVLKKDPNDMFQSFMLLVSDKPTPTPTPTPTPKPTEPSLIPDKLENITYKTPTNDNTIKNGSYHIVVNNRYVRSVNEKPITDKDTYVNSLQIESRGGRIYAIRSAYGAFLSLQYRDIRNGDQPIFKWIDDSNLITGWLIEPVDLSKNLFTIRPMENKNYILSAEDGRLVLTTKPSNVNNTRFTIFPYKP